MYPFNSSRKSGDQKNRAIWSRSLASLVSLTFFTFLFFKFPLDEFTNPVARTSGSTFPSGIRQGSPDGVLPAVSPDHGERSEDASGRGQGFISTKQGANSAGISGRIKSTGSLRTVFVYRPFNDPGSFLEDSANASADSRRRASNRRQVLQELDRFEEVFSKTVGFLLPQVADHEGVDSSNPFKSALSSEPTQTGSSGESESDSGADDSKSESVPTDSGTTGTETSESDAPTPPSEDSGNDIYYSFLVVSEAEGISGAFRAHRKNDGGFLLENGYQIRNPVSGLVGIGTNLRIAPIEEKLMTADWNGDQFPDLFAVTLKPLGTLFRIQSLAANNLFLESSFLYRYIQSLALFNMDEDPESEIILVMQQSKNLMIYDLQEGRMVFQRELVIPFPAAAVFETADDAGNSYLHVLDRSLARSLTFPAQSKGVYFIGDPPTLQGSQWVQLDSYTGFNGGATFLVLFYRDRLALIQVHYDTISIPGSFSRVPHMPQIIIGDFYYNGNLQMLFLP